MRFEPKTEDELNPVFEPGPYEFLVKNAEDAISKRTGADMIKLTLQVWRKLDGVSIILSDYLLESMGRKLWNFCSVTGLMELYESGELTAQDCVGRSGILKLKIEKDKNGDYPDKNVVGDYITEKPAQKKPERKSPLAGDPNRQLQEAGASKKPPEDDDIPF